MQTGSEIGFGDAQVKVLKSLVKQDKISYAGEYEMGLDNDMEGRGGGGTKHVSPSVVIVQSTRKGNMTLGHGTFFFALANFVG